MATANRKPERKRTISTFADDSVISPDKHNKALNTKLDSEDIKLPVVTFKHIDYAVKHFFNVIDARVEHNGQLLKIPSYYASPETWKTAQKDGHLRDAKNKLMLPLMIFKKTSTEIREELSFQKLKQDDSDFRLMFESRYTNRTPYDKFSKLTNQQKVKESYTLAVPDYVKVNYDIIIWTEYIEQLNTIIERFLYYSGKAYGQSYKFIIKVDSYDFETSAGTSEDRLSRCNVSLNVNAFIIPEDTGTTPNQRKIYSTRALIVNSETVVDINDIPTT